MPPPGCGSRTSGTASRDRRRGGGTDAAPGRVPHVRRPHERTDRGADRSRRGARPDARAKVFLTSGGSDSVDTATKMVRRYWSLTGQPERTVLIRREKAYHGMHTAGTSLAGIPANADGYGALLHEVVEVPWDDADALYETIDAARRGPGGRLLLRAGDRRGRRVPGARRLPGEARGICRDHGCCSSRTRSITGFGRCGAWFASERFGLEPDLGHVREGDHERVPAARRGARRAHGVGAVLARGGRDVPPRLHVQRARSGLGGRAGEPRHHRARGTRPASRPSSRARSPPRSGRLTDHRLVIEVRGGVGVLGAVQLDPLGGRPAWHARVPPSLRARGIMGRVLAGGAIQIPRRWC